MVFVTEKYVFIDSEVAVDNEKVAKEIQKLPKTFIQQLQKTCKFITEYSYDEHKKCVILVCRFENKNDFCETTRMESIAKLINIMHKMIAMNIVTQMTARGADFAFKKAMNLCSNEITKLVKINGDEEISDFADDCDEQS